jgi:hypothetical protein
VPFSCSRWASHESANHSSANSRIVASLKLGTPSRNAAWSVRVKDVNVFELTPGLADALSVSLDASYLEYFTADCSGTSTKEAERRLQPSRRGSVISQGYSTR